MVKEPYSETAHAASGYIYHNNDLDPGGNPMNKKYLSFVCLLALTVGGCTQHMAKDDGSAPPVAESNQQSDGSQAKAAAENIKTALSMLSACPTGTTAVINTASVK